VAAGDGIHLGTRRWCVRGGEVSGKLEEEAGAGVAVGEVETPASGGNERSRSACNPLEVKQRRGRMDAGEET
jgi:hypothetical protein